MDIVKTIDDKLLKRIATKKKEQEMEDKYYKVKEQYIEQAIRDMDQATTFVTIGYDEEKSAIKSITVFGVFDEGSLHYILAQLSYGLMVGSVKMTLVSTKTTDKGSKT